MIRKFIKWISPKKRQYSDRVSGIENIDEVKEFYENIQWDILEYAHEEYDGKVTKANIWEIVIREGLYQNLTENPSVALGFLLNTTHGPTSTYKEYLELANNHSEVMVLIAISALVNDAESQRKGWLNDIYQNELNFSLGNLVELDYENKLEYAADLQSDIDQEISILDFIIAKAEHMKDETGLYDRPLIDLLNTDEYLKYYFKAEKHGYSFNKKDIEINPTGNGSTYHLFTNRRVLTAVGRKDAPDMILSIPIHFIRKVEIHNGWTKDRIKIETKRWDDDSPYNIWAPYIGPDNEFDIVTYLEEKTPRFTATKRC